MSTSRVYSVCKSCGTAEKDFGLVSCGGGTKEHAAISVSEPVYADDEDEEYNDCYDDEGERLIDGVGFADEGSGSALRAATRNNPRNRPCPKCREKNVLTPIDVSRGYVCDRCADRAEGKVWGDY